MPGSSSPNLGPDTPVPLMPWPLPSSVVNGTMSPQGAQAPSSSPSAFDSEATQAASGQGSAMYIAAMLKPVGCVDCAYTYVSDTNKKKKPLLGDAYDCPDAR